MSEALFDFSVRALACINCGAPLTVAPSGGTTRCAHCGSAIVVEPRRSESALPPSPPLPSGSYDPQPFMDAHSLTGRPWDHTMPRVREIWMDARKHPEVEGGYRLYASTLVLSSGYTAQGDQRARRAVLETALELLHDRGHRCILRCHLARAANRLGERDAAKTWFSQCDTSDVAQVVLDEVRVTEASLARDEGQPARVLELLSSADAITGATASLGAQLRVDALERVGQRADALAALRQGIDRHGQDVFVGWMRVNEFAPRTLAEWGSGAGGRGLGAGAIVVLAIVMVAVAVAAWWMLAGR